MEFKDFIDPNDVDFDIKSSVNSNSINNNTSINEYSYQLVDLIGVLDDVNEEDLQAKYGISVEQYYKPDAEIIAKVTEKINSGQNIRHR